MAALEEEKFQETIQKKSQRSTKKKRNPQKNIANRLIPLILTVLIPLISNNLLIIVLYTISSSLNSLYMIKSTLFQRILGLSFLSLAINASLAAQQTSVIDFNSPQHNFTAFGGCSFSVIPDPTQGSNQVGQFVNSGGTWEGAYLDLPSGVLLDSNQIISLDFYNPNSGSNSVILKLEGGASADIEVNQTTQGIGWRTLQFDYSQAVFSGSTTPVNGTGSFNRFVLFIDGSQSIPGTYAIDNITFSDYSSVYTIDVVYDQLAWEDNFNYQGTVDPNDWFSEVVPPNAWGWHNGESQHYTNRNDNSFVANGHLSIVAKRETYTAYGLTQDYTSARLNSNFSFTYGRVDVRAKLPRGDGTWPAIWMLGTSIGNNVNPFSLGWPDCGEIDIMEHWGNDQDRIHGSIHTRSSFGATVNTRKRIVPTCSDSFHVYSLNWSPNQLTFLIDDEIYYVYNPAVKNAATWPFDDPEFILLNVAMGSSFFTIDPNFTQDAMLIDYVRVFQDGIIGLPERSALNDVRVYPNPSSKFIQLKAQSATEFVIFDLAGKEAFRQSLNNEENPIMNIEHLDAGVYIWKALEDGAWQNGRLLIQRD